jgi:hypothetical protein
MAMEYQGFATLGVNLNRQKYGPLDVSSVFISVADLNYYTSKGTVVSSDVSSYWKNIVPYPYAGQVVSLVVDKDVFVYKLVENDNGTFDTLAIGSADVDLTNYTTKAEVQEMIDAIEMPEGITDMIALTKNEVLAICK